jgi:putative sterol carrier protein
VQGPELFMSGRLRVEGDFLVAAKLAGAFAVPGAES